MNFPESGRGLGHVTPTIFGSTVGYPSDSLASCLSSLLLRVRNIGSNKKSSTAFVGFGANVLNTSICCIML